MRGVSGHGITDKNVSIFVERVTRAQEDERLRISRELHDTTIQSLIMVLHQLERYLSDNQELNIMHMRFIINIQESIKTILQEVRHLSQNLRPSIIDHLGLLPAIEFLLQTLEISSSIKTILHIEGKSRPLNKDMELIVFRIIQEALSNVKRHAEANLVEVTLKFEEDIKFYIADNGKGIEDSATSMLDFMQQGKLGLAGMSERAKLLGGDMKIISSADKGTTIEICIPGGSTPNLRTY
ncbi:sensor histidine kinase [Desulforamulus ruminis]|uniref:sensor histidine kinase n=1 Tax=Desulforamulus ruminis TaxID=1564 RepID=UPI002354F0EA|nr:sensor histidine kinase [Desulforamulus ruminis]